MKQNAVTIAILCGFIALAVHIAAVFSSISTHRWQITSLIHLSRSEPMAHFVLQNDPQFFLVSPDKHYDGVYFYAIALDPFAQGIPHTLIDQAAYWYGHPGFGWITWIISLGNVKIVPIALLLINLFCIVIAAISVSLTAKEFGWSSWSGLFIAFHPGLVVAATLDTAEPAGVACLTVAVLCWIRERFLWATIFFVIACFIKEPYTLIPLSFIIWNIVRWLRKNSLKIPLVQYAGLLLGPVLLSIWYLYVRFHFGIWSFQVASDRFSFIVTGWLNTLWRAGFLSQGNFEAWQLSVIIIPFLCIVAGLFTIGIIRAIQLRSPFDSMFLLFMVLVSQLNWMTLLYPKELFRILVIPLLLLPAVLSNPRVNKLR